MTMIRDVTFSLPSDFAASCIIFCIHRLTKDCLITGIIYLICQTHIQWVSSQSEAYTLDSSQSCCPAPTHTVTHGVKENRKGRGVNQCTVSYQKSCPVDDAGGNIWCLNQCVDKIDVDSLHWFIPESRAAHWAFQLQEQKENISLRTGPSVFVIHHPPSPASIFPAHLSTYVSVTHTGLCG